MNNFVENNVTVTLDNRGGLENHVYEMNVDVGVIGYGGYSTIKLITSGGFDLSTLANSIVMLLTQCEPDIHLSRTA